MSSRYYDSSETEIKPGKISAELREALNIPENDLPIWIYRMRALGYPPGWLRKAVVDTNDIFDTDSSIPTNEDETHEANQSNSKKRKQPSPDEHQGQVQYDHSKLIEYPGFNAPMPKGCTDYHYYVNMPAMLEHQQLDYAKKHMNSFKPIHISKKIKTQLSTSSTSINANESTITNSSSIKETSRITSPEIITLDDSSSETATPDADNSSSSNKHEQQKQSQPEGKLANTSLTDGIKLLSKGSPMPKPVQRAPLEKFSQGVVGELLYFENIPASTGKFESIRGLLNNIRRSRSDNDTSFGSSTDKNQSI